MFMFMLLVIAALAFGLAPASVGATPAQRIVSNSTATFKTHCVQQGGQTVCTDTSLYVFTSDQGAEVCVSIFTYRISCRGHFEPISSESGCAVVPESAFTIDTKTLSGATLSDTTVTLEQVHCTRQGCEVVGSREVTVAATFTGIGELTTSSGHSKYEIGNYTYFFTGKSAFREAEATFTLNGEAVDPLDFLSTASGTTKVICR